MSLITKIDDRVFLADWKAATNLSILNDLEITKVISIGNEAEMEFYSFFDEIEYLKIVIEDKEDSNISEWFDKTNHFLSEGNCLVHCRAGISRSVTIILAYLMNKGMSYQEAFSVLKAKKSNIKPNPGFVSQLKSYSVKL